MADFSLREELCRFWQKSGDAKDDGSQTASPRPAPATGATRKAGMESKLLDGKSRRPATPLGQPGVTTSKWSAGHWRHTHKRKHAGSHIASKRSKRPWLKAPPVVMRDEWEGSRMAAKQSRSRSRGGSSHSSRRSSRLSSRSSSSRSSRRSSRSSSRSSTRESALLSSVASERMRFHAARMEDTSDSATSGNTGHASHDAVDNKASPPLRKSKWDDQAPPSAPSWLKASPTRKKGTLRDQGLGAFDQLHRDDMQANAATDQLHLIQTANPAAIKKRREVYMGNLLKDQTNQEILADALRRLFSHIPEYHLRYGNLQDPIRSMQFPPSGGGMFAFVEMFDEVLASTALMMSGFELCGRPVKARRPSGYVRPPNGELAPLDVTSLRMQGFLPISPDLDDRQFTACQELYFGNLLAGSVTQDHIRSLLMPVVEAVIKSLPMSEMERGTPITKVSFNAGGSFCFVQFSTAALASKIMPVFDGTELFGRKLKVGRPSAYPVERDAATMEAMMAGAIVAAANASGTVL